MARRRCGYCFEYGHNRRTCPDIKKSADKGSYWAKQELERRETVRKRPRRCGYCKQEGHNRKTCIHVKNKLKELIKETRAYRQALVKKCEELGFGVGSLIRDADGDIAMVLGVDSDIPVNAISRGTWSLRVRHVHGRISNIRFPQFLCIDGEKPNQWYRGHWKMVGKCSPYSMFNNMPVGWRSGKHGTEDYLPDEMPYHERRELEKSR